VLAAQPENVRARLFLASSLAGVDRSEEALQQVELLLQKDPSDAEALALRAKLGK